VNCLLFIQIYANSCCYRPPYCCRPFSFLFFSWVGCLSFSDFPEFGPPIVCFSFFAPTVFLAVAILIFAFFPCLAAVVVAMLAAIDLP